jgi:DNA-directed RNA polymerase II subunit RPB7
VVLKMFFKASLVKELSLEPAFMGKNVREMVQARLKDAVEGKVIPYVGFVIHVVQIGEGWIGTGVIDNDTGASVYHVSYEALVFRPFLNEVLDMIVTTVNGSGFKATVGGMFNVFVHRMNMASGEPHDPSRFEDESWVSPDGSTRIRKGCGVRLRIKGVQFPPNEINGTASMKDDYTGLIFE